MSVAASENSTGVPLELFGELRGGILWRSLYEKVNVIWLYREMLDFYLKLRGLVPKQMFKVFGNFSGKHRKAILRAPNNVIVEVGNAARCRPVLYKGSIRIVIQKAII
jgi:hypothetical protein